MSKPVDNNSCYVSELYQLPSIIIINVDWRVLRNSYFFLRKELSHSRGGGGIDSSVNCDVLATPRLFFYYYSLHLSLIQLSFSLIQLLFRCIAKSGIPPATWTKLNCKPVGN